MNAEVVVAVVFIIIFVIGVTVGIIAVIALANVRAGRRSGLRGTMGPGELEDPGDYEVTGVSGTPGHWDGSMPESRPYWPGPHDDRDGDLFAG